MKLKDFCDLIQFKGRNATYHITVIGDYERNISLTTVCNYEQLYKNGYMDREISRIYNPGLDYSFEHYYIMLKYRGKDKNAS